MVPAWTACRKHWVLGAGVLMIYLAAWGLGKRRLLASLPRLFSLARSLQAEGHGDAIHVA